MLVTFTRKFLLQSPELPGLKGKLFPVSKGLLSDDGHRRIFLNQSGRSGYQNIDTFVDGIWQRQQIKLSTRQFLQLWPLIQSVPLQITRQKGLFKAIQYRIESFSGHLEGLNIAHFTFATAQDAYAASLPTELGPEITFDRRFNNFWLMKEPPLIQSLPVDLQRHKFNFVVGVIPYLPIPGNVEIVTVKTRKKGLTIFPKGQPESKLHAREVARLEAIEEAGIEGLIHSHPIMIPFKSFKPQHWILYPMEVTNIMNDWKEKGVRNRSLVKLDEAIHHPRFIKLDPALRYLSAKLGFQSLV